MSTNVYELPISLNDNSSSSNKNANPAFLPKPLLIRYALWFCYLRWIVIGFLGLYGGLGLSGLEIEEYGLMPNTNWSLVTSVALILTNILFHAHIRFTRNTASLSGIVANLWIQVISDLLILTFVVHFVGSLDTHIPYVYLFHIVLACIFFPPRKSLMVTLIASGFYLICVLLEINGIISLDGIFLDSTLREHISQNPMVLITSVTSVLAIWFIVWYFASHLSAIVRERNRQLAISIHRLTQMQDERKRHMLRTTHELKAPFAAIHANTQLLLDGYCGDLTQEAKDILIRISERSRRLALAIQEMLQMSNLSSITEQTRLTWIKSDISKILQYCIKQMHQIARENSITIEEDLKSGEVVVVEEHIKMLFQNLLSNAITYSHKGGSIQVTCESSDADEVTVCIEDHGIGIRGEKISRIFEEYYRTEEATQHNKGSTGLGLAIVRHIAITHNIQIRVESEPNAGTKFILRFPSAKDQFSYLKKERNKHHVISADN